jgi:hypothetical protein
MPNTFRIAGQAAELRWGYATAATLGAWAVAGAQGDWTFTATIVTHDTFRVSQRPLKVVTPNGWRWPVLSLQITDRTLTASIGPTET